MIIIFRAVSGAGKNSLGDVLEGSSQPSAETLAALERTALWAEIQQLREKIGTRALRRVSADAFFTKPDGTYNFDAQFLTQAHAQCMRNYIDLVRAVREHPELVAVSVENTNCSIAEVAPYCQVASAYQLEFHVITLLVDPLTAWRRNVHGTPITHVVKQDLTLRQSILEWPPWWPQKVFPL